VSKFKKQVEINAIQYTGNNLKTVQKFAGKRDIDLSGKYTLPNFDDANIWWPDRRESEVTGLLWLNNAWYPVPDGYWIIKDDAGDFKVLSDEQFQSNYGEPVE
jgi:hypothetical protein